MLIKRAFITGFFILLVGVSSSAFSQFGTRDNTIWQFTSENLDLKSVDERLADVPYGKGKSIFRGRGESSKLSYCVVHKGEKVEMKRSTMGSYKQNTYMALSEQLYNCANLEQKIINTLPGNEFVHVLYYLNVKYKLGLQRS